MQPSPEPIEKLIKSFEEIQRLLESIRASKQKIIDGYKSHGSSDAEALKKFQDDVRRPKPRRIAHHERLEHF